VRFAIAFAGLFSCFCAAAPAAADYIAPYSYGLHRASVPDVSKSFGFAAVAGKLPGAGHPLGTLILGRPLVGKGVTLTEWDLALKKVVREVRLGWPEDNVTVKRSGDLLYLAAGNPHARFAVANAATLSVVHQVDFGAGEDAQVASDGVLTVASWHRARTWTMVALDANARIVARIDRAMPSEFGSYPMHLAVLSGHAYAILGQEAESHVLKLSSSLAVEKEIQHYTEGATSFELVSDHLVLGTFSGFDVLSADLDNLGKSRNADENIPLFAADPTGRIIRASGEFYLRSDQPPAALYPADVSVDAPMPPLWVGDIPVLMMGCLGVPVGIWVGWIDLNDPNRLPRTPARYGP
jgi:hypothetical protein